jgi:hypothetical protein
MGSVVTPVLLALVVALAVLVLSAVASAGRPPRELLADARDAVRGGLRRERWTRAAALPGRPGATGTAGAAVGSRADDRADQPADQPAHDLDDDEETSVADLFSIGQPEHEDYVRADRFAAALERAGVVVVVGVQQVQHRVRR